MTARELPSEAQATPTPEEQLATWAEGQMEKAKRWYEKPKGQPPETKEREHVHSWQRRRDGRWCRGCPVVEYGVFVE